MVTRILCILFSLLVLGCGTTQQIHYVKTKSRKKTRVTYYCGAEDKRWGTKTASGSRIAPGRTVAAAKEIPFGTRVSIPALAPIFGNGNFVVEDRGRAVDSRKASRGICEVIDVACASRKMMKRLAAIMPPLLDAEY